MSASAIVGIIGVIVVVILFFFRIWIGIALALVGFLGFAYLAGLERAFLMIGTEPFRNTSSYTLSAIPLFILMGMVVSTTGIGADLYKAASKWVGHVRGGLAMATVIACGGFAAVTGSSMACTVTMGKVAYPEMIKYKYQDKLAAGCISAGGTIGILIPPSIGFIVYGLFTETSIGKLFIAGIIPGITEILFYIFTIYIICRIHPQYGPPGPRTVFKEKLSSLKGIWPIAVLFMLVIGGIYGGIFTPTEAGAIGAFGAIVISFISRRVTIKNLFSTFKETAQAAAMITIMITGAFIFSRFLTVSRLPVAMGEFVAGLDVPPYLILAGIVMMYLVIGCFLEIIGAIILTLPVIFPVVMALGYDPIWFGVVMVRLMEVGAITPPMGLNIFLLAKVVKIPIGTLYRSVFPFVLADIAHIALLIAFPSISLFLVELM